MSMLIGFTSIAAPPVESMACGLPFVSMFYARPSWQTNGHYFHFWTEVHESLFCSWGSLVTNQDVSSPKQTLDLRLASPFLTYLFIVVGVLVLNDGLPLLDIRWSRPVFEGEGLMVGWILYNGILMFICLLACLDVGAHSPGASRRLSPSRGEPVAQRPWPGEGRESRPVAGAPEPPGVARPVEADQPAAAALPSGLNVQMPARETEAALIQPIYAEKAWFQRVKRVGSLEALFLIARQRGACRADPAPLLSCRRCATATETSRIAG